jgi:hypothetical protein
LSKSARLICYERAITAYCLVGELEQEEEIGAMEESLPEPFHWTTFHEGTVTVALLIIPLLQAFGLPTAGYPMQQLNVMQVILVVTVFARSLLLSFEGLRMRSERMHGR